MNRVSIPGAVFAALLLLLQWSVPAAVTAEELIPEKPLPVAAGKSIPFRIKLDPAWKYLKIDTRFRCSGVTTGAESWQDGRLALRFLNAENRGVGPLPRVFHATGDGNVNGTRYHEIPEGAHVLLAEAANFGTSGTVTFDRIAVTGITAAELEHPEDLPPPDGSTPEEIDSLEDAYRESTPTRERISLNGLWRFRPEECEPGAAVPPENSGWGYFKVPGIWPDRGDSDGPNDAQELHLPPATLLKYMDQKLLCAWYRRAVAIPVSWRNRKIRLFFELLQGSALIYLDGKHVGTLRFPGGAFDLPGARPGTTHDLAILVSGRPGEAGAVNFTAPERMTTELAQLANRGITGDLYLESLPSSGHIEAVAVTTSVAEKTIKVVPESTVSGTQEVTVRDRNGRIVLEFEGEEARWENPELWSPQHPERIYTAEVRLKKADGTLLDQYYPVEFGFREFSISGRDFLLNGVPFPLRALVSCHVLGKADRAGVEITRNLCRQAKMLNANFLLPENYDFAPGRVTYLKNFYRETTRAGLLSSFTLPHAKEFNWKLDDPEEMARYRKIAQFLIRQVRNNPGVVLYAMNHNATGYFADQNPLKTDSSYDPDALLKQFDPGLYRRRQAELARRCAAELDPTRPAYHHQSGKLGVVQTLNCYLNWLPPRERADYFVPWSESGELPLFLVEYGLPHVASYSSYRGPGFIWTAWAKQTNYLDEYNAEYLGHAAFRPGAEKLKQLLREEKLLADGKNITYSWIRPPADLPDNQRVLAEHIETVLTDFRMRGVSGVLPWDQYLFWRHLGKPERRESNPDRYKNLKQPGIVPDFFNPVLTDALYTRKTDAFMLSVSGEALRNAWAPRLARFGERGWNLRPGEKFEPVIELRNDSGEDETWRVRCGGHIQELPVPTGHTVSITFPAIGANFGAELRLEVETPAGILTDKRTPQWIEPAAAETVREVEIFDPDSSLATELNRLGIPYRSVETFSDRHPAVIARNALPRYKHPLPEKVNVLLLEQSAATLESLGFRAVERGFRRIFDVRTGEALERWRGDATLTAPWLETEKFEKFYPMHFWQGFYQRRSWRGGNAGSIASVVFEKPERGDFRFRYECGFQLQYTPLAELRENGGDFSRKILFCQLDVTGRTEPDPLADRILTELLTELGSPAGSPRQFRPVRYDSSEPGIRELLEALQIEAEPAEAGPLEPDALLVTGAQSAFAVPENGAVFRFGVEGLTEQSFDALPPEWTTGLYARTKFHRLHVSEDGREVRFSATARELLEDGFFAHASRRGNRRLVNRLLIDLGARPPEEIIRPDECGSAPPASVALDDGWVGIADPENRGRAEHFENFTLREAQEANWRPINVPGNFESNFPELRDYDGAFWYLREFDLPADPAPGRKYKLHLGAIDDESWCYLNGSLLGEVTQQTHPRDYYTFPREYTVDGSLLKRRGNRLTVLVNDLRGNGGILGTPYLSTPAPERFHCEPVIEEDNPYRYYRW